MNNIREFERFLLSPGQVNRHVHRRGETLLSLPNSVSGAAQALKLYHPQRLEARLKSRVLHGVVRTSLHRFLLKAGEPATGPESGQWDFQHDPATAGIMPGSSDHVVPRAIASYRGENGWEVAKLGLGPEARRMLENEAAVLAILGENGGHSPPCLGLHHQEQMCILRMPRLEGDPHRQGNVDGALDLLETWSRDKDPKAMEEFQEWEAIRSALETNESGRKALGQLAGRKLSPSITHGDFAAWNLLSLPQGRLIALDWEWGNPQGMPGLDLVHYFAQDARLVRRMPTRAVIHNLVENLSNPRAAAHLARVGWDGSPLEPMLASIAYKQGAKHQKNPELLAVCLEEYTRFHHSGRPNKRSQPLGKTLISVVTPSFHQVDFLKCCAASVRDQQGGFEVEHLIHDGGSGAEFDRWARSQNTAICVSEKDDGMYDAINRGFRKARGNIIAWLNCDEQYLPGTLETVARYFDEHPETDILFGDLILVDEVMTPLAYRRAVLPTLGHIRHSHLSTFSAATFVRRRVLDNGHFLQPRWKTIADAVWIEELLAAGYRGATLGEPLASFCMLGSNLGQSDLLYKERVIWENEIGATHTWKKRWHILRYRIERLRAGAYLMRRVTTSCYIRGNSSRTTQERWVSGQWSVARDEAAELTKQREGAMGGIGLRLRRTRWAMLHAAIVIGLSLYVDALEAGDAVKGPSFLLFSLLYLSFRSKLRDLVPIACAYFLTSLYLLSERPPDVLVTRLATFTFGGILAVFWSASLRNLEAWIRSTVMLIRRMSEPTLLADRNGRVILVNIMGCSLLGGSEASFMGRKVLPLDLTGDGSVNGRLDLFDQETKTPEGPLGITLEGSSGAMLAKARVFVVGKGSFRVYAFTLESPAAV
jgi:glycosyltransferase involved in cell wall biosynthesis